MKSFIKERYSLSILLVMLFFSERNITAQSVQTPKIVPPSPTAQTFTRYGEIPIDYSTGVPGINISLFTVAGKMLNVPISISYHASGIKVNDVASEIGLGWALNAGGIVSRSVNGIRDEAKSLVRTFRDADHLLDSLAAIAGHFNTSCLCLDSIMVFENFLNGEFVDEEDPMNDRFFYKLPNGLSGIFTYGYRYPNADSLITLPYRPIRIKKYISGTDPSNRKIDSIRITDNNGIVYILAANTIDSQKTFSDWFLKKMISADGTDSITFSYAAQTDYHTFNRVTHIYNGEAENTGSCYPSNPGSSVTGVLSPVAAFNTPVLESISSSTSIVKFVYGDRTDFDDLKKLVQISVHPFNAVTDTIRKIQFIHKYFGSTNDSRRLGLDSVIIRARGNSNPEVYTFTYESQVLPPYPFKMITPTYNEDYWGYNNGSNSPTLLPFDFISNSYDQQAYGGNREAGDYYYSKACLLKEIKYPTGGKTAFEFERHYSSNAYPYHPYSGDQDGYIGGFRVASITNYSDNVEVATVKSYAYEMPVTRQIAPEYFDYMQYYAESGSNPLGTCWTNHYRHILTSNSILPLQVAPGMPIMYQRVIEYAGTPSNNIGKTVYTYDQPYSPSDYFSNPDHPLDHEGDILYHPYHYDKGNYVPELLSKTVYSFDGTTYRPVNKEEFIYSKLFTKQFNTGIKLTRPKVFPGTAYFTIPCPSGPPFCSYQGVVDEYLLSVVAIDTKAYQEASMLTQANNYVFNPLDSTKYVLTSTDYTYKESNLEILKKATLSSEGDTLKIFYKYPIDFADVAVYDTMVRRNILSSAIEELHYQNSDFLTATKTNYNFWTGTAWTTSGTNQILPQTVDAKYFNQGSYETRLRYFAYDDKNNILSVSKESDHKLSYIWDYNDSHPIAEVVNADNSSIAYTSFESTGKGNWVFSGSSSEHNSALTGTKGYSLSGGSISNSGLSTGSNYVVSFWKRDSAGTVSISSGTGGSVLTRNGWVLYRYLVSGASTITISGTAYIDEVRLHPIDALMTTYTYKPLIGRTSQCNAQHQIIYYEYDDFGRLRVVKDQDMNVVSVLDYQRGQNQNQ